jgi:hypothetical protein
MSAWGVRRLLEVTSGTRAYEGRQRAAPELASEFASRSSAEPKRSARLAPLSLTLTLGRFKTATQFCILKKL